jgi:cyanate permease
MWAAVLTSATASVLRIAGGAPVLRPGAAVAGAVGAAIIALAPALIRRRRPSRAGADTATGLA